jgi:hypothetical protein
VKQSGTAFAHTSFVAIILIAIRSQSSNIVRPNQSSFVGAHLFVDVKIQTIQQEIDKKQAKTTGCFSSESNKATNRAASAKNLTRDKTREFRSQMRT